jgi:hypothetical protein
MADQSSDVITITRQQLYDQVWNTPIRKLAASYGLSDVGLAKVCKRHNIPRPPVGYWAKKEFGKAVEQEPLPNLQDPDLAKISFFVGKGSEPKLRATEHTLPMAADLAHLAKLNREREEPIEIPATLHGAHLVVTNTRDALNESVREKHFDGYGMTSPSSQLRSQCFAVKVGRDSVSRVLRLLNALTRALEPRGFALELSRNSSTEPEFAGFGAKFTVSISEKSVRSDHVMTAEEKEHAKRYSWATSPRWDYQPSGHLTLTVRLSSDYWGSKSWKDSKRSPLENQLDEIIREIPFLIDRARLRVTQEKEEARRRAEEQRRRYEEEKRKQQEAQRIREIMEEAVVWSRARTLRDYADTLRAEFLDRRGPIEAGRAAAKWFDWLNNVVASVDPIDDRMRILESSEVVEEPSSDDTTQVEIATASMPSLPRPQEPVTIDESKVVEDSRGGRPVSEASRDSYRRLVNPQNYHDYMRASKFRRERY